MAKQLLPSADNVDDLGNASQSWKKIYVNEFGDNGGNSFSFAEFQAIKNMNGWGIYADGETSPATQVFTTTAGVLEIDGFGVKTNVDYVPLPIRNTSNQLWDTLANRIAPIAIGDSYEIRVDLEILAKTGSPTFLDMNLDIGGGATITIPIVERIVSLPKTPPYSVSFGFPIFTLDTFFNNGGQLFFAANTGTVEIGKRSILLTRISSEI